MEQPITFASFEGRAHVYGDNIDTDRIIPGKYTKTLDNSDLARHVLEDLDPQFSSRVRPGDILVAGGNFGCGSSREQAPLAIQAAGVAAVVAGSFSRIFYRNAINIGLPLVEIGSHDIQSGCRLRIDLEAGTVVDLETQRIYSSAPMPPVMISILRHGGLVPYLKKFGDYQL
jgi:3-isopropylmalate dehydratase small subunit